PAEAATTTPDAAETARQSQNPAKSQASAPTAAGGVAATAPTVPSTPVAGTAYPPATAPTPAAALEATLRMATEAGFNRARLTLHPEELGSVEVLLRDAGTGLTAPVLADAPHAAHLLEGSAAELQRRLAEGGLELTSLQISVGGESAGGARNG